MDAIGTVVLALAVPVIWGLVSAWAFDWLRERSARNAASKRPQRQA